MIKYVIKRNGKTEEFHPDKLNKWGEWAAKYLGDRVDWPSIVLDAVRDVGEVINSQDLQNKLIDNCIYRRDWAHNVMAGRLYVAVLRKKLFDNKIPTVKELQKQLAQQGLMRELNYSDEEYDLIEGVINHDRDFNYPHSQTSQLHRKYSIQNRTTNSFYETPQFIFMRMAMALAEEEPKNTRILDVINYYNHFSKSIINAPSPNYINLGTHHYGLASCCIYTVADKTSSLAAGDHIAYVMTYMSAGIGSHINVRSLGDKVRNGLLEHQGKLPYFRSLAGAVKANLQAGRGGACTAYYSCFDPEALVITMLQNPRTPLDKQNRDIHFAIITNRLFAKRVAANKNIFTFNVHTAKDLTDLFYSGDQDAFEALYEKYENDPNFEKNYISARSLLLAAGRQSFEVSTLYYAIIDEINRHTPFKEKIYSSNLCLEIVEPTHPFNNASELYSTQGLGKIIVKTTEGGEVCLDEDALVFKAFSKTFSNKNNPVPAHSLSENDFFCIEPYTKPFKVQSIRKQQSPEVALCSLAAINVGHAMSDEEYEQAMYYSLKMIDKAIHISHYELPYVGYTAKKRLNAGIGIIGLAYHMAKLGLRYDTPEGLQEIHKVAERHMYFAIKASLRLGKELGNAPWIHKTKWPDGWLPIDTYKKTVDELVKPVYEYDWESLRQEIIANKGIRNSCLVAHMPTESSSKASGVPNGVYPIRDLHLKKSDQKIVLDWCPVDGDLLADKYQKAYEINSVDMIKAYSVIQKFTDQAISADLYKDRSTHIEVTTEEILNEYFAMVKYGLKSRYYQNSLTTDTDDKSNVSIVVDTGNTERGCAGGSCTL